MSNGALRLSPSGPVVTNAAGGSYLPVPGSSLRLVEGTTTVGGSNVIPTAANYAASVTLGLALGGPALTETLTGPQRGLNYRATVLCDVPNPSTNGAGEVQLYLETSVDGGVTWLEQASNTHLVEPSTAGGTARQIRLDMTLRQGAVCAVPATPNASNSLQIRARIGARAAATW